MIAIVGTLDLIASNKAFLFSVGFNTTSKSGLTCFDVSFGDNALSVGLSLESISCFSQIPEISVEFVKVPGIHLVET